MSSPNAFASFSIFKGDITTQDFMHLVRESDGSVVGWIDQNGTPQGTLATGGGGGTSIFVNSVLVPNPNFLSGAGIDLQVVGSNVSVINTGVTSINSLIGAVSLTQGSGITITPSGNSLIFSASGGSAGVSSLNTLTGALSLIAGTNVSFNSTSSSITVNAATAATVTPWADIQAYGGNPHKFAYNQPTAACTTVGGSPNVTLSVSGALYQSLKNGQGICIWEAGNATTQTGGAPTAPTCTSPAVQGAQTITYQIVGYDNFGGLTAASSAATVTNAPAVFSPLPVAIATASASGGVVTLTFTAGALNNTLAAGMTIHVVGITGSGASWNGVWTTTAASAAGGTTTVTYNVSGATGTGTLSASSTGRLSNSQPITAISLAANGLITITTAQAHNYQVGATGAPTEIIIENCTPAYLNGYYSIVSASGTSITVQSGFLGSAVSGSVTAGSSTATVWEHIVVACPQLATGTVGYYVYSDNGSGDTPTLIGKVPMGDCNFEDYGQCLLAGYAGPGYVPSTPPGSAQNQMFTSTIVSGGGTTSIVLADNVPTGISALSATLMYDDGPNLVAACVAASGNSATTGSVILTPPNSNSDFSGYIFNSPITIPQNTNVIFACEAIINETWTYTALNQVSAQFGSSSTASPSFATQNFCNVQGGANPIFYLGENLGNTGGITIDGLCFTLGTNGQTAVINTCFFTRIANCGFKSSASNANSGSMMAIIYLGSASLSEAENLNWTFANRFYAAGTGVPGQSNLGPCRLPAIWFRGSTNTALPNYDDNTAQFTFRGKHSANGRGITFDQQYSGGNANQGPCTIGSAIWMQQGTTPVVSVIGDIFYGFKLTNIVNDTSIAPALANMSIQAHDFTVDGCSSGSAYSVVAGNPVINLSASGNAAQLQAQFQKPSIAVFTTGSTIVDVINVANSSSATSWKLFAMNQSAQLDLSASLAYIQYVFNGLVTVVHSNTPGMEFGIEITVGNS